VVPVEDEKSYTLMLTLSHRGARERRKKASPKGRGEKK